MLNKLRFSFFSALSCLALAAFSPASQAAPITYSTSGEFFTNGVSDGSTLNLSNGGSIAFFGLLPTTVNSPTNISYGDFDTHGPIGTADIPNNTLFVLTVHQYAPSSGTVANTATVTGSLMSFNQSTAIALFSNQNFMIGAVNYHISEDPAGIALVAPNSNLGVTTIQGSVSTVPEPASMLLLGAGLLGLGLSKKFAKSSRKAEVSIQ